MPLLEKPELLDPIMCRQTVGPKCRFGLKFRVTQPNLELRWSFRALKGKMTFAFYRQRLQSKDESSISEKIILTTKVKPDGVCFELQNMMEETLREYALHIIIFMIETSMAHSGRTLAF